MPFDLAGHVSNWLLLVLSLTVHEWAHAWTAWKLGDDTAERQGRLSFNPLVHIDPVGTVLLPLLGVPFGWARPVPVVSANFHARVSPSWGMMVTAIAGPISNLLIASSAAVAMVLVIKLPLENQDILSAAFRTVSLLMVLNVVLAVFNMLPIVPLDGSRVANHFMPRTLRPVWERFVDLGPIPLLLVIVAPRLLGFSLIDKPVEWISIGLIKLVALMV